MKTRLCLLALALALTSPAQAQTTGNDLDAVLEGFEDAPETQPESAADDIDSIIEGFDEAAPTGGAAATVAAPRRWGFSGALTASSTYNYAHEAPEAGATDFRGLSRLRAKLNLEFDAQLSPSWKTHASGYAFHDFAYALNGRDDYGDEVLDDMESEAELGETYLRGTPLRGFDLTVGRQIAVWGKSDNLRITDVVNPLDSREPGIVDIEDLRLPLTMAKFDWYPGNWGLSAMAIHEIRFDKTPAFGSEFHPFATAPPAEDVPSDGRDNTEYAVAATGYFSGWDLSLYWAQVFDDQAHVNVSDHTPVLEHSRLTMNGAAANMALGNWLLKAEAAHFSGLEFGPSVSEAKSRTDALLGVEYSGFRDTTLSLEVADRHVHGFENALSDLGVKEDTWQVAGRYQQDFMHARLHLTALGVFFGLRAEDGGFTRLSATYDLADALSVTGGVVTYKPGSQTPFEAIADNDRLLAELKYSF